MMKISKIVLFKPYSNIKDFLERFTILKIGNFHVRLHFIKDKDKTTLFHNHPFNYISLILKGGYSEIYLKEGLEKRINHSLFSIIKRSHNCYHRIDEIKSSTITLFIAYGKYQWNAFNMQNDNKTNGIFQRNINNKILWSKKMNGIWFIGNNNKKIAENENRHSIHQI